MTKKDIAFIKKIIGNSEYTPVMRIVSCYVNTVSYTHLTLPTN